MFRARAGPLLYPARRTAFRGPLRREWRGRPLVDSAHGPVNPAIATHWIGVDADLEGKETGSTSPDVPRQIGTRSV
jgi:hypothetical protein